MCFMAGFSRGLCLVEVVEGVGVEDVMAWGSVGGLLNYKKMEADIIC